MTSFGGFEGAEDRHQCGDLLAVHDTGYNSSFDLNPYQCHWELGAYCFLSIQSINLSSGRYPVSTVPS
jgi:hypothetical protein